MIDPKTIQNLDLNLLKVFEILYRERNMTRTAEQLFISPSAVSHAVKRLRETLGDDLFIRQGSQLHPTPSCQRVAPHIVEALQRLRQVLQAYGEFKLSETTQTIPLAMPDALEPLVIPKLHAALAEDAPLARLSSIKLSRETMRAQLGSGHVLAAIDVAHPVQTPIHHTPLAEDHFVVLMRRRHALQHTLTNGTYTNAQHMAVSNRPRGHVIEDFSILTEGLNRDIHTRCQSYQTARALLKASDLLLTVPSLIADHIVDDAIATVPLPLSVAGPRIHLYWHTQSSDDEILIWLKTTLKRMMLQKE